MALAETAQLVIDLQLKGNYASQVAKARGSFAGLIGGAGKVEKGIGRLGGAFSHAGGQIRNLLTGPLGIIGLTGGLFSLGGIFESSVRHASDMGFAVEKLTGLTGESATSMSTLLVTFEKFGITADKTAQIIGFTEKTLGALTSTEGGAGKSASSLAKAQDNVTKAHEKLRVAQLKLNEAEAKGSASASSLTAARYRVRDATAALRIAELKLKEAQGQTGVSASKAAELQAQYGVALLNAKGKVLPFATILGNVADYYNSNAQQSDKAHLAALLFGRGYAQLIPLLKLGSKGIQDAQQAAADLGLTLTEQNAQELKDYRQNIRDVGEAIGGLQLQIGLRLIPEVNKLATGLTSFLEHGGTTQIADFFESAAKAADTFGTAVTDVVLPVFGAIASAWGKVPDDLKKLLIGGFVVNKASKFLFDFGIKDAAKGLKGIIEGLLGKTPLGKVASAADPGMRVFVTNWPIGFGGGGPNVPAVAKNAGGGILSAIAGIGGAGLGAIAISAIAPAVLAELAIAVAGGPDKIARDDQIARNLTTLARGGAGTGAPLNRPGTPGGPDFKKTADYATNANAALQLMSGSAYHSGKALDDVTTAARRTRLGFSLTAAMLQRALSRAGIRERSIEKFGAERGGHAGAVERTLARNINRLANAILKSTKPVELKLSDLKKLQSTLVTRGDVKGAAAVGKKISDLKAKTAADAVAARAKAEQQKAATRAGAQLDSNATHQAGGAVVSAIRANRPITNVSVSVRVSGNAVTSSVNVTSRTGTAHGSRDGDNTNPRSGGGTPI